MISVLLPEHASDWESQLSRIAACGTLPPFSPQVMDFLDAVSKTVLLDNTMRAYPETAAVAHWMRKAHILRLRDAFDAKHGEGIRLARGVAIHFAPANVDSIFVYSWFVSMLMGNANIIRLSPRRGEQANLLLSQINSILKLQDFRPISDRSLIVSYERDDDFTQRLSQACHIRVLWGGDESVRQLRAIPLNPLASEVVFANRFSLAVLNPEKVLSLEASLLEQLAARFCNDSYWFDQKACSSPRLVVWAGDRSLCQDSQEIFWAAVSNEVSRRGLEYPEIIGINKLVCAYAAAGMGYADRITSPLTRTVSRIHLDPRADAAFRQIECGGGLFFETEVAELGLLVPLLTERDQTLSYFGFSPRELKELTLRLPTRAIDRVVPIGSALNFTHMWAGLDLLESFSRGVVLEYPQEPRC